MVAEAGLDALESNRSGGMVLDALDAEVGWPTFRLPKS